MSQPTSYNRGFSFTDFAAANPSRPLPGAKVDQELNGIELTLDQVLANLAKIQRDDGALANGSVGVDQLSATAIALIAQDTFSVRGAWLTATAYLRGDFYSSNNQVYLVMADHTSTSIVADIASGKVVGPVFLPADRTLTFKDFGAIGGGADDTLAIQAALNWAVANYPTAGLDTSGNWCASKLTVSGGNGLLLYGQGVITANSNLPQTCLLELKMPGFKIDGLLKINVGYRTNYETGVWWYATGSSGVLTSQFSYLSGLVVNSAKIGIRVGAAGFPSALSSEMTMDTISTYGCPVAAEVVGTETFVNMVGCNLSADAFGGDASWQALPKRVVRAIGGGAIITGGECLLTSATDQAAFELQPLTGVTEGTFYGSVTVLGATIENSSPFLVVSNPNGLTISSTYQRRGLFMMSNCRGYHANNNTPAITTTAHYVGDIFIEENRFWYGPGNRTQPTVLAGSANTHVYIDAMGMGDGFLPSLSGISGGTAHFSERQVLSVQDPQSQSLSVGDNTIVFKAANGADTARGEAAYSTSTGLWTSEQGYANLRVATQIAFVAAASGTLKIVDNGTAVRSIPFTSVTEIGAEWSTANYPSGSNICIIVTLTGAGATVNASGFLSRLTIEGRN